MASTTQSKNISKEVEESSQPTWQDIEKALIDVVKAGLYYKKPKDGKFLQNYKKRINELRKSDDPTEYIMENAQDCFQMRLNISK